MNQAQRIVLVIALGIGLLVIAVALNLVMTDPLGSGWFRLGDTTGVALSPSQTDNYFVVASDRTIIEQAAVWVAGVAVWTGAALWLLRTRRETEPT